MNKQRKVLITTTYNEMGIIIDTKAEEVAQPNLQPTCNQLATDTISRQAAIRWVKTECNPYGKPTLEFESGKKVIEHLEQMPSAQPEIVRCKDCRWGREACGNIECFVDSNIPPEYHGYEWYCPNGEKT